MPNKNLAWSESAEPEGKIPRDVFNDLQCPTNREGD